MAVNDLYRLIVEWQEGSIPLGVTVLGYRQIGTEVGASGAEDLTRAAEEFIVPQLADIVSATFLCSSVKARGVTDPTEGVDRGFAAVNGARGTGDTYARSNGAIISWKTGLIGRSFNGRTFVPPSMEGDWNSTGIINPTYAAEVAIVANNLMVIVADTNYTSFTLQVISEVEDGVPRPTPIGTPVTTYIVRSYTGIQRRRRG